MERPIASYVPAPVPEIRGRPLSEVALQTLWYRKRVSRADLSRHLGISRSTASEIVSQLIDFGLVTEVGDGPSQGGRRPILVEFMDRAHVILGVDMGASHIAVCLTDLRGRILDWKETAHPVRTDPVGTREKILELCKACVEGQAAGAAPLLGIGIALPAPVDHLNPMALSTRVLPAWEGQCGFESLASHFGVPLFVDNDANLGAVAEQWWGAGRGIQHFAYIKLGTGIGAGLIMNGTVFRGETNAAGEIGHISIDPKGKPCVCGNRGCLVTVVGGEALVERAHAALASGAPSLLSPRRSTCELTPTRIEDAALQGDPLALQVIHEAAHSLGVAIAGLLNVLNPGTVILGGSLARLEDELLRGVKEAVAGRTLVTSVAASPIRTSELGSSGIALGAATLVLSAALAQPSLFRPESEPFSEASPT